MTNNTCSGLYVKSQLDVQIVDLLTQSTDGIIAVIRLLEDAGEPYHSPKLIELYDALYAINNCIGKHGGLN